MENRSLMLQFNYIEFRWSQIMQQSKIFVEKISNQRHWNEFSYSHRQKKFTGTQPFWSNQTYLMQIKAQGLQMLCCVTN